MMKPIIYHDHHFGIETAKIGPGEYYITQRDMMIVTVLGSCVSACIRDPVAKVGGMNHFMLPQRDMEGPLSPSARYGAYAMEVLINQLFALGARRERLEAKVFGAARVLPGVADIGERNAAFAIDYLKRESIAVLAEDFGSSEPCKIYFFVQTGRVLLKRLKSLRNDTIARRERDYAERLGRIAEGGTADLFR